MFCFCRICSIDIGDRPNIKSFGQMVFFVEYQWYNIYAYLAPPIIGNTMGRISLSTLFFLAPISRRGRVYSGYSAKMNYLYFYSWDQMLFGSFYKMFGIRKMMPFHRLPDVPLFFGYAGMGLIKWHKKWAQEIPARGKEKDYQGCYVYKEYPNCAHWVQCESETDWQQFNKDLLQWLRFTDGKEISYNAPQ